MGTWADVNPAERYPDRARVWQLRRRRLELPRRPLLMGIVNVTPDSFSDGGQFFDTQAAVDHALHLAADGADLIDIGGESTRPHSTPVSEADELERVIPVIREVCGQTQTPVSIDNVSGTGWNRFDVRSLSIRAFGKVGSGQPLQMNQPERERSADQHQ